MQLKLAEQKMKRKYVTVVCKIMSHLKHICSRAIDLKALHGHMATYSPAKTRGYPRISPV